MIKTCLACKTILTKKDTFKLCAPCYVQELIQKKHPEKTKEQLWWEYYQSFLTKTKNLYAHLAFTPEQIRVMKKMVDTELKQTPLESFKYYNPYKYPLE